MFICTIIALKKRAIASPIHTGKIIGPFTYYGNTFEISFFKKRLENPFSIDTFGPIPWYGNDFCGMEIF